MEKLSKQECTAIYEKWIALKAEEDRIAKEKELLKQHIIESAGSGGFIKIAEDKNLYVESRVKVTFGSGLGKILRDIGLYDKYSKVDETKLKKDIQKLPEEVLNLKEETETLAIVVDRKYGV